MTDIVLTDEQYKTLPYAHTTVTRARTYGEIIDLLEAHGIHEYKYLKSDSKGEVFSFPIKIKRGDVTQGFLVNLMIPKLFYPLSVGRGRNAPKKLTYLEDVSWRTFWWYLKSKLEAIEYGISDDVKEFMYNITYSLMDESGKEREISLGEKIREELDTIPKLMPQKDEKALEYRDV